MSIALSPGALRLDRRELGVTGPQLVARLAPGVVTAMRVSFRHEVPSATHRRVPRLGLPT